MNTLVNLVEKLRADDGCPWDKNQNYKTLKSAFIEESYELVDAINNNDIINLEEEIGDVLLCLALIMQVAEEKNDFTYESVMQKINEKVIRRHPFIFADKKSVSLAEQKTIWNEIKSQEKAINKAVDKK